MKFLTGLFVVLGVMLPSFQAQAITNEVIFLCDMPNNQHVLVERNPVTDVFVLTFGTDLNRPEVTVMKRGNNLGTSAQASKEDGNLNRELYVTDGDNFYTVIFQDKQGVRSGFFQRMVGGSEVSYAACNAKTFRSKFDDYELFDNLTIVD